MKMACRCIFLSIVLLFAGCSDDTTSKSKEAGVVKDTGSSPDLAVDSALVIDGPAPDLSQPDLPTPDLKATGDLGPSTCSSGGHGFVFDRVIVPTDSTSSSKYALVHKGKLYNSLGGILALISSQAPSMNFQSLIDESVCSGAALHLLCLQAKSLSTDPAVKALTWPGTASCCTSSPCFNSSSKQCGYTAQNACFSGTNVLSPVKGQPAAVASGSVSAGALKLGPGKAVLYVPLPGASGAAGGIQVVLKGATISGTVVGKKINSGILAGAVDKKDLNTKVIPALATGINATYTSPTTDTKTKDLLKTLFDTNKDGKITTSEVQNNGLIKTFLDGDVDVDGDGVKELSVGVGYTAVGATVK